MFWLVAYMVLSAAVGAVLLMWVTTAAEIERLRRESRSALDYAVTLGLTCFILWVLLSIIWPILLLMWTVKEVTAK